MTDNLECFLQTGHISRMYRDWTLQSGTKGHKDR